MTITRYIHIGYPKCASSALQYSFFARHPEIYHLGIGCGGELKYISDDINIAVEVDFRFRNEFQFDAERVKKVFEEYFERAEQDSQYQAVGISSELLSYTWTTDIDVVHKARRLHTVFGADTVILMVIRNQMDLLHSLYCEFVKEGYPGTYQDFMDYTYMYRDRNWCHELCFDKMYDLYSTLFGAHNIKVVPYELLKRSPQGFLKDVSCALNVSPPDFNLETHNERFNETQIDYVLRRNREMTRSLGRHLYEPNSLTRYKPYFTKELGVLPPDYMEADRQVKNVLKVESREATEDNLDLTLTERVRDYLLSLYAVSNRRLGERVAYDLEGLGYLVN